ncbi:MAG TPA: hypothetical protein VES02_11910, partial [Dermatophilaceae bacterium]|nr:hypothetical protein [Dermatophilaceae bacterium]
MNSSANRNRTRLRLAGERRRPRAAGTRPADTRTADTKPASAKPVTVKPVETKPASAKPVTVKPVDAKPLSAKPVDAKPLSAKPVDAMLAVSHRPPGARMPDLPTTYSATAPAGEPAAAPARGPGWMVAGLALLLATGALVTSLVIWRAAEDRHTQASSQAAAASAGKTITEKMLGYDYRTFDQHTTEVSGLLTGSFRKEFVQAASTVVKPLAVGNKAVVVAQVSKVAVMSPRDQADVKILVFVDQRT